MRTLLILILSISLSRPVVASEFEGVCILAGFSSEFPCEKAIESLRGTRRPAIQLLWRTFGTDFSCARKFVREFTDRRHLVYINFSNQVCVRNRNCSEPDITKSLFVYRRNVKRIYRTLSGIISLNTVIVGALGLEDDFPRRKYLRLERETRRIWPYEISRNPHFPTRYHPEHYELHTISPCARGNDVASLDGFFLSDGAVYSWAQEARRQCDFAFFVWLGPWQGRYEGAKFTMPDKRSFQFSDRDVLLVQRSIGD